MTETTQTDASQPDITVYDAPDVSANMHNLINLIDSLHSRADFNPQHVSQVAQIKLDEYLNPPDGSYEYIANVTSNWGMTYTLWPNQGKADFSRIYFRFWSQIPNESPPMTDICVVDLDAFHNALLQQGYAYRGLSRTALLQRDYRRGNVDITVGMSGESDENVEHVCIEYVGITASEGDTP